MMTFPTRLSVWITCATVVAGCASLGGGQPTAKAELQSKSGSSAAGTLTLREEGGGVRIKGDVRGLAPASTHGFHVHEKGDCSAPDASSAGPHFNPAGSPHGKMGSGPHHEGDMPNIVADKRGTARIDVLVPGATLGEGPNSVSGRAVVVHRDPDDYQTQPAGNAGPRIACGVIH